MPKGNPGIPKTTEHRKNISESHKGSKQSAESNLSRSRKSKNHRWITDGINEKVTDLNSELPPGWKYGRHFERIFSSPNKGLTYEEIYKEKAFEQRKLRSNSHKKIHLEPRKHIDYRTIFSFEYKIWREQVFKRDNWTCRRCGKRGGSLHAHHIKSFTRVPALRYKVLNGKTLCADPCHRDEHKELKIEEKDLNQKICNSSNYLLTSDIHLTDSITEAYRWKIFDVLQDLALKYEVSRIFICGDFVDRKDRHSALLVNQLISKLSKLRRETGAEILIIAGNHEKPLQGPYYWEFINQVGINYITNPAYYERVWLLPFSSNPIKDWDLLIKDFQHADAILMHQTVEGALIEGDRKVMSHHILPPLPDIPIFSGDVHRPQNVHRPQTCNKIIYIGVPHPVRFGESWENRVILIKHKNFKNYLEIPVDSIRRDIIEISNSNELKKLKYKAGDQLRIRFKLKGENLTNWPLEEEKIRKWVQEKGIHLASLEATIEGDGLLLDTNRSNIFEIAKPEDVILQFCKQEKLSDDILQMGLSLLKEGM